MNEKQLLTKGTLPNVFVNTLMGFAAGMLGTMVMGLILLLTWSIVGEVLAPTNQQVTNELGEVLTHKQNTHPLFLSVIIWAVFMATLAANVLQTVLFCNMDERYNNKATTLTQVAVGNVLMLLVMIPIYLVVSSKYGAAGVGVAALIHSTLTVMFSALAMELLSLKRYTLVSVYGIIFGLAFFFLSLNVFSTEKPTLMALSALPLLLGMMTFGRGIFQLVYFWFAETYANDFLDIEKRFGADYGQAEEPEAPDDFSQEFGDI